MAAYVIRRLWQMVPTMAGVILLVFFLFNWVGGDPAYVLAGLFSSQEQIASIRKELGLDEPIWVQLLIFVSRCSASTLAAVGPLAKKFLKFLLHDYPHR
ncbi:MAG: hypothetical protein ACO3AS_09945 [Burkholderiaceae bacterium]